MDKKRKKKKKREHSCGIGGQAVIEGIMMKNKEHYSVAVRTQSNEIEVAVEEYESFAPSKRFTEIPFIRGVFNFIDSLILGTRALTFSSSFYEEVDEKDRGKDKEKVIDRMLGKNSEKILMGLTIAFSVVAAVVIFMLLPYFISRFFSQWIPSDTVVAILEGVIRILIFVGYVTLISLMKDIRRVYMYHGAEHKCINCVEKGYPLNVENVKKCSRQHKRCGTSFMLFVMLVSILFFIFIRVEDPVMRVVVRILLIPVIAGVSYEVIRLAGNNSNNIVIKVISAPGMWLQKLTTKEPDDSMIEVAIAAVEAVFDWKTYFKEQYGYDADAVEEPIYASGQVAYTQQADQATEPVYGQQPMYEGQPNYEQQPMYEGQPGFEQQPMYEGQLDYEQQPMYEGQPNYGQQPMYEGQPDYGQQPMYEGQPDFEQQPMYEGQLDYEQQPMYEQQSGYETR